MIFRKFLLTEIFGRNAYQTSQSLYIDLTSFSFSSPEGLLVALLEKARCNGLVDGITINQQPLEYNNQQLYTLAVLYTMNTFPSVGRVARIYRIKAINSMSQLNLSVNQL